MCGYCIDSQVEAWTGRLNDVRYECNEDFDQFCSYNHRENREAIKDLIDGLYADNELNIPFIKEKIEGLARDYDVIFDYDKPLHIQRVSPTDLQPVKQLII